MNLDPEEQEALAFLDFQDEGNTAMPQVGEDVAGYRLLKEIGSGGGGVVFEALQVEIDRKVAIKMIPLHPQEIEEVGEEHFRREARLLASLEHPGIIEIFDSGVIAGYRWVAMQHVAGPALREVIHGEAPTYPLRGHASFTPFLANILHQIARALAEAHGKGVLHLDVKPSNILLESPKRAFLVDFGISRTQQGSRLDPNPGFRGTATYAAPEQLSGHPPTPASDVYAFGCMAFEALNGEVPFPHAATVRGRRDVQIKLPVWTHARGISKDLLAIINRCLEKDAADRYPSGQQLAEDLDRFLHFEPVLASNRSLPSRMWLRMRLRPRQSLMACSILLLVLMSAWLGERLVEGETQILAMQASDDLRTARNLFHQSAWGELDRHLASLDLTDPRHASILSLKADLHLVREQYPQAKEAYHQAMQSHDLLPGSQLGLAYLDWMASGKQEHPPWPAIDSIDLRASYLAMVIATQLHEPEVVLTYADRALELHPTSHFVLDLKATACSLTGRHSLSIEILQDCLALNPSGTEQMVHLIQSLNHLSRYREARDLGEGALLRGLESVGIHLGLSQSCLSLRYFEEAWTHTEKAYALQASEEEASQVMLMQANLLRGQGKRQDAISLLSEIQKRDPENPTFLASMARHHLRNGDVEKAQELVAGLSKVNDYRWRLKALMFEIRIHNKLGRKEHALELLALPEMIRFGNHLRVEILRGLGRTDEAIQSCYQAIEEEPSDLGLKLKMVELLRDANRLAEAQNMAMHAYALDPGGPGTSFWLASVLWRRGDVETALNHVHVANAERPEWLTALFLEGECLRALGRDEEADVLFARYEEAKGKRGQSR